MCDPPSSREKKFITNDLILTSEEGIMSKSSIRILSLCTNEILQRIRTCLEKDFSFEVKVIQEAIVLSNIVQEGRPNR